jgi:hypothetical protein
MNAIVELKPAALITQGTNRMAVAEMIAHVSTVQEVMRAVMKKDVHYGMIPGTDKPTLFKAGAEVLSMVFRIADTYEVTDLSTPDMIRYRVNCIGRHQVSDAVLGSGLGEASSAEEKYKWRKAVCVEEWNETPAHLRRKKYGKAKGGGFYTQEQVRTEPSDLANTVLKMANKRAKMAMVLNVTAASDCFAQDLEDMDEALLDHLARHPKAEGGPADPPAPPATYPAEAFGINLPKWREVIVAGRKTAEQIIAMAQTKHPLTEDQKAKILAPVKPVVKDEAPKFTYAQVADRLVKAGDIDALNIAADLIGEVADPEQRRELSDIFNQRNTELQGATA